jgi:hypothetical protein
VRDSRYSGELLLSSEPEQTNMTSTRRQFLAVSAGALALAGCVGGNEGEPEDDEDEEASIADWQRIDGATLSSSFPMGLTRAGTEEEVAEVHRHKDYGHWHQMPLELRLEEWHSYEMAVLDTDLERIPLGEEERHRIEVVRTEDTPAELVEVAVAGRYVDIKGKTSGTGALVFRIRTDEGVVFTSPALTVEVSEG